jgi:hypothetical protein
MWQGTIAANREVWSPGAALPAAAARFGTARFGTARFGTPRYVTDMVSVTAAAATLEAALGPPWRRLYSLKHLLQPLRRGGLVADRADRSVRRLGYLPLQRPSSPGRGPPVAGRLATAMRKALGFSPRREGAPP